MPAGRARSTATAFAPATVANVAAGFDVLGFAVTGVGDTVTVVRDDAFRGVSIERIAGLVPDLPTDPARNTASVALLALLADQGGELGFRIAIDKGIPLGSGMGGSAASAVAAVVAANALLDAPLPRDALLAYALAGEEAASGARHADNAAPCLHGGLTAVVAEHPPRVVALPVPAGVSCVLVHPHLALETRSARAVLPRELPLGVHVSQSIHLAGFIVGCFRSDLDALRSSMVDLVAEPHRSRLIPGFADAKAAAHREGALGFSIAGSGPSVFAWVESPGIGARVAAALAAVFRAHDLDVDIWTGPIRAEGAAIL